MIRKEQYISMSTSKRLFVGNLSFQATADEVRQLFQAFGEVASVNVVTDSYTGRSRGFAFVEMQTDEGATKAREGTNGKPFQSRNLTVDWARPMTKTNNGSPRREREPGYSR